MSSVWSWLALLALGAYHGINPGMGWLFAVALGMQERSRRAVIAAIPPIALGHALSIGAVVGVLWLAQASVPEKAIRYGSAAILFGFGLYRLVRAKHFVRVGMRVGFRDLTLWSFLMASVHGAGLMLVPFVLGLSQGDGAEAAAHTSHAGHTSLPGMFFVGRLHWLAVVLVHSAGYLLVATLIALLVYEKLGLAMLRRAWFNLDLFWVFALMASGVLLLFL